MKILIVRMFPNIVNVSSYNLQEIGLAKALIKKGHKCDIVYYNGDNENKVEHIEFEYGEFDIYWLKGKDFFGNGIYDKSLYELSKEYDVVQTSEYNQIKNVKLSKYCKKMVVYHGPYKNAFEKKYMLKCKLEDIFYFSFHPKYKKTKFIAKSELAKEFLNSKGYKNVETIGVGLDISRLKQDDVITKTENEDETNLLYIGQMQDRRNIMFLIDVLKRVSEKNSNVKLTLIGKGPKEYVDKCFEHAKEIDVYNKMEYIEKVSQDEIAKYYSKADMFLLPTEYEIFGMVLAEAMYFGLPVITTLNGGSSTIIKNGETGFIENIDIDKWTDIILKIANKEIQIDKQKVHNVIVENYTWDKLVDKFIEVYEN